MRLTDDPLIVLRDGRERLAKGWVNRPPSAGEDCVVTAVAGYRDVTCRARHELTLTLAESCAVVPPLTYWNDAPGRTKKEVLNLFDRTITRLEASE